tara:strand:+ start:1552 stop:1803 length:252 start_codon:yes stop_codon:yes gene_type:complete
MSDILNMEKVNSIGSIIVEMTGSKYDLEFVCVETGLARINVSGLGQNCQWSDFTSIFDWDESEYDPDLFYSDCDEPLKTKDAK